MPPLPATRPSAGSPCPSGRSERDGFWQGAFVRLPPASSTPLDRRRAAPADSGWPARPPPHSRSLCSRTPPCHDSVGWRSRRSWSRAVHIARRSDHREAGHSEDGVCQAPMLRVRASVIADADESSPPPIALGGRPAGAEHLVSPIHPAAPRGGPACHLCLGREARWYDSRSAVPRTSRCSEYRSPW